MEYNYLGDTGIKVSKMAFGTLTVSPLQKNMKPSESLEVFMEAFNRGVNFFDTAEGYDNYDHLRNFLKHVDREKIVISTKTYAYSREQAKASLAKALNEMNTTYVDIFMLHEQLNENTIKGHYDAIEYFLEMKEKGIIKAIGISTHFIEGVKAFDKFDALDVIHPIVNKNGLGICDGNINEMVDALRNLKKSKGIFGMKALGGGNLLNNINECFDFVLNLDFLDSIAVGMQNVNEVIFNVNKFEMKKNSVELINTLNFQKRELHIGDWCVGCGKCVDACQQNALSIVDGKAVVDSDKCTLCGYCSAKCFEFCIKII
ncbi:MAG: aldo/keto reductase [Bacillota bacterium]|nr:aldo/keto reductase [Bacillota bacterium]